MRQVKIAHLRNRLSEYIRQVERGNAVTVLDRNTPVALITPISSQKASDQLWGLVQQGRASWEGGKPEGVEEGLPIRGRLSEEILREIRDEGR